MVFALVPIMLLPAMVGYVYAIWLLIHDERTGWGAFSQSLRYY